jgi:hypothetical protein
LDLSKLRSIMYRGKSNVMLEGADDGINSVVSAMSSLLRTGDCNENGSGTACASSFTAFTPSNGKTLWEDALIACPFFGRQSFASSKTLPIARAESWPYGTAAMIQKVRLMNSVNIAVDNSGVTADNIDSRVASLFRSGTTALVGAYLTQKGSAIGGYDRVKVLPAKVEWSEITTYCDSSASGSAATVTGAVEDLGSDFQFPYANEDYIPAARASALASGVIKYDNVTITHDTLAWSTVDITEIVRNQLHWWYLNSPTEPLELNLLWSPDYSSEDRTFGRTHYPLRAGGDVLGDFDLIVNATRGRTEWYTSESNDPPLLQLFFQ